MKYFSEENFEDQTIIVKIETTPKENQNWNEFTEIYRRNPDKNIILDMNMIKSISRNACATIALLSGKKQGEGKKLILCNISSELLAEAYNLMGIVALELFKLDKDLETAKKEC